MRTLMGVCFVVSLAQSCAHHVKLLPPVIPVDATRPYFLFPPVQGTACGDDADKRALDDLFRISSSIDGFVSASSERAGECVTVTAQPIRYGCDAGAPLVVNDGAPTHVVPSPDACGSTATACDTDCARFATALASSSEFKTRAVRERCVSKCRANDAAFMTCARAATTPDQVSACDSMN